MTDKNIDDEYINEIIDQNADDIFGSDDVDEQDEQDQGVTVDATDVTSEVTIPASKAQLNTDTQIDPMSVDKAKKHGYLSKEQYISKYGTEEGFKSPDQFNKYGEAWGEVKDVISNQKKQLDEQTKQIDALVKFNERVEERAAQRARAELEAQIQNAKDLGDVHAVEQLSREQAKQDFHTWNSVAQQAEAQRLQVQQSFVERNKHWFNINPVMTERARQIDMEERQRASSAGVTIPYDQLANVVEARLRVEYPETMISRNAGNTAPNISSSQSAVNKVGAVNVVDKTFNSLSDEHKQVFEASNRSLRRQGRKEYSKQEYVATLKKYGDI